MSHRDTVLLSGLRLPAKVGCTALERGYPQLVKIDLAVDVDATRAAQSGKLSDTVCYAELVDLIRSLFSEQEFVLVEELGLAVIDAIFARWAIAQSVQITVGKQVLPEADWSGVQLYRAAPVNEQ